MGLLHTMEATLLERRVWSGALDMLPAPAFLTLLLLLVPLHPLLHTKVTLPVYLLTPCMLPVVCTCMLVLLYMPACLWCCASALVLSFARWLLKVRLRSNHLPAGQFVSIVLL